MTSDNERRLFKHLLRLVSILMIIEQDHEKGHTAIALPSSLASARRYLMEHCPALLLFTELCYRDQAIPDGLSQLAELEAVRGRHAGIS